ncbi:MAG: tRNA (N6-isopentenyl adenosine(37)-C2)-methylthiotransferase MiaB [Alphaproteobacteria bacterium]|nr:tRNA (N6-isopentenyl adenosine(37)-C2)-methylthiotransferase MiaB [Alphaproteobacteria bacterium]
MPKRLYIKTYGCQMNVYDSDRMIDLLKPLGYELTEEPSDADIAILNTCHIREKAEQKVYSDLGRLKQQQDQRRLDGNDMLIGVGGCVGQAEGAEIIKQAPYVSMVFGPQTYHRLPEMITQLMRQKDINNKKRPKGLVDTDFPIESKFDSLTPPETSPASAFLAIQEGCDKFCTFCVVPYTRGAEFSRPASEIIEDAKRLVSLGAIEITLLGQNVNAYHGAALYASSHGKNEWGLARLMHELSHIDGLKRIRYTTSHPRDVDQDLIDAHRDIPQLMPFIHLPVQSGSDRILEAMNRKHTASDYLKIIEQFKKAREDIAFSSDFIIGFPGEADADHKATLALIEKVRFGQAYSFKYSIRPGTPAGAMELQVEEKVKSMRLQELQHLLGEHQLSFNKSKIGTIQPVLFDRKAKHEGQMLGKTPYMQSVPMMIPERLLGKIIDVKIEDGYAGSLLGSVVTDEYIGGINPSHNIQEREISV